MTIGVLLVDDQALIRSGFRALIDSDAELHVVGEASNGREALAMARSLRPDIVLMDIRMPELDGISATREITHDDDLAGVRVIVLTTFEIDEYVIEAMRAGASGFLDKGVEPATLLDAIRVVAGGDALLTPRATRSVLAQLAMTTNEATVEDAALDLLTPREREVVSLVGRGMSNDEIAASLYLSPLTAKTHVNRAMMKLSARDRAQLVTIAFQTGLTKISDVPPRP